MTLDIHAHTIPESLIKDLADQAPNAAPTLTRMDGGWRFTYASGRSSGPVGDGMFEIEARLEDMDKAGVAVQALSVPPTHFCYDLSAEEGSVAARLHNDAMLAMASKQPSRFVVLAHLPLQDTERALLELDRLVDNPTVVGVEFATNVDGRALDDAALDPVWSALDHHGLAAVLHPHTVAGANRMQSYYLHNFVGNPMDSTLAAGSLMFGGVLSRHRRLRIALLHGGGFLPYQLGRFDHGWKVRPEPKEHLDVKPSELLSRFWFDTLTHDRDALRFLHQRVGSDRLCLGSDYPFDMADEDVVDSIRSALGGDDAFSAVTEATPRALLTRSAPRT